MPLHIREVNYISDLAPYRAEWDALLSQTSRPCFFQSLDWLEAYWRHYGGDQALRVLLTFQGDSLAGILPLVVRTESTKAGRIRFITYPLDYWGSFFSPVGPKRSEILQAGLAHIRSGKRDWDAIELRWLGGDDSDAHLAEAAMASQGLASTRTIHDQTAIVQLDGTWEQYLGRQTSKWRNNYRRWQRRLNERGEVVYTRFRPRGAACGEGDPRWDLFDDCLAVAENSWQGSSHNGTTLSHPQVLPFLRDVHESAAAKGALDVNLLYLDGRPIAFAYNYYCFGHLFGLRVGYDAQLSRDGAGNLLYAKVIEDSFARQDRIYDLGPGSLDCKRYFQTAIQPMYRLSYFRLLSLRSQMLRLKRCLDARGLDDEAGETSPQEAVVGAAE